MTIGICKICREVVYRVKGGINYKDYVVCGHCREKELNEKDRSSSQKTK